MAHRLREAMKSDGGIMGGGGQLVEDVGEQRVAGGRVPLQDLALRHLIGEAAQHVAPGGRVAQHRHRPIAGEIAPEGHAAVVGEDLGTVEPYVREEMARRDILSTRLLWFEPEPPARYPERSMGAVTTHDLPTIAGLWTGADLAAQRAIGRMER